MVGKVGDCKKGLVTSRGTREGSVQVPLQGSQTGLAYQWLRSYA